MKVDDPGLADRPAATRLNTRNTRRGSAWRMARGCRGPTGGRGRMLY